MRIATFLFGILASLFISAAAFAADYSGLYTGKLTLTWWSVATGATDRQPASKRAFKIRVYKDQGGFLGVQDPSMRQSRPCEITDFGKGKFTCIFWMNGWYGFNPTSYEFTRISKKKAHVAVSLRRNTFNWTYSGFLNRQ